MYQIDKLLSAFSEFQISTQSRPDGGLLLKLQDKTGRSVARTLSYHQLRSSLQIEWVIAAIRRDLAMQPGDLPAITSLQSQHRFDMPTYIHR